MTRTECDYNSWLIEDQVFGLELQCLINPGIVSNEVVHDDKYSIDAILCTHGIVSQKDLWHKCKNVMKKFVKEVQSMKRPLGLWRMLSASRILSSCLGRSWWTGYEYNGYRIPPFVLEAIRRSLS